jgi:hypothetical protein
MRQVFDSRVSKLHIPGPGLLPENQSFTPFLPYIPEKAP